MYRDMKEDNTCEIKVTEENEQKHEDKTGLSQDEVEEPTNDVVSQKLESETSEDKNKYLDQLLRLQAEFTNYKKRVEREKLELSDFFKSELVGSLLPVIDDFERMLDHTNDDDNEFLKGIKLIYQKLMEILEKEGLRPIQSIGQKFDPSFHEALIIEPGTDGEDEIIVEEWRKGYLFNDRLLRPAQVKVLKTEKANEN